MKKIVLLLLAGSVLVATGCKKTGPMGPKGATGATGATGPAGPAGLDGNANVIGTTPFTVLALDWTKSGNVYSVSYTASSITSDIVDFGIVSIFKSYATNTWTNLPDINGTVNTYFDFYDGGFTIYVENTAGTTANPGAQVFRMVVISSSQKQSHPATNWKNYNETMMAISNNAAPVAAQ